MALHESLRGLPWALILALTGILTVYFVYRRRPDLFERFGFGTREVTFVTLLPVAGWAVNFPFFMLGRSTLALNLGGAIVPVVLCAWIVHRGILDGWSLGVTVAAVAATSIVSFEIVRFEPDIGIIVGFPWFFLPAMAASGLTLVLLARRQPRAIPAAYVAGSLGALIGADFLHMGEIAPYMMASADAVPLSIGGAGPLDMVFLSGLLAMAFNLVVVAIVNPSRLEPARREPSVPFRYPAGLELVHDPQAYVIDVERRRVAGHYIPPQDRIRYHLAKADLALESAQPGAVTEHAQQAVRDVLDRAEGNGLLDEAKRHPDLAEDVETVLSAKPGTAGEEGARDILVTAKLLARVLDREAS